MISWVWLRWMHTLTPFSRDSTFGNLPISVYIRMHPSKRFFHLAGHVSLAGA